MTKPHRFTAEERMFLEQFVPGHSHKEITAEFAKKFPPGVTESQIKSAIKRYHLNTGHTGRFEKGTVSHNKGQKMLDHVYKAAQPTMFKPGSIPPNTLPVGTELVFPDGYTWVKINDLPKVKKAVNWRQKHRLLWEQNFGEIPEGYLVIFKDGDKSNFDLDNLACISKQVNLQLSRKHLRYEDADLTEAGIAVAKVICAITDRKNE